MLARKVAKNQRESMEEKYQGNNQVCMRKTSKELGKKVYRESSKELSKCACKKCGEKLGKCVCKKSTKELVNKYAIKVARN